MSRSDTLQVSRSRIGGMQAVTLALALASAGPTNAGVILVNTTADSDGADALCSIREALFAAATDTDPYQGCSGADGDDTIWVFAGNYAINSTLNAQTNGQDITLSGLAVPPPTLTFGGDSDLFDVQAGSGPGRFTISALDLDLGGQGHTAIRVLDNTQVFVTDSVLRNATAFGVDVQNTVDAEPLLPPHVRLDGVTIDSIAGTPGGGIGLNIRAGLGDGQEVEVIDSVISECELQGIRIEGETDLTVSGSTLTNNGTQVDGGALGAGIGQALGDLAITDTRIAGNQGNVGGIDYRDSLGIVDLEDVQLIGNEGQDGGGALLLASTIELDRLLVESNENVADGGGLTINGGTVTLNDSVVVDNFTTGSLSNGGGIAILGGPVTMNRVAVIANHTVGQGGGIFKFSTDTLSLTNVTVSGNSADDDGGGIYMQSGNTSIRSTTITDNVANSDDAAGGFGGGLYLWPGASANIGNSILGGNRRDVSLPIDDDCNEVLTSVGYNLITTVCGIVGTTTGNITGVATGLGPLAPVGGDPVTFGHVPPPSSPALEQGSPTACPSVDQRNLSRPFDGDGSGGATCDIGAIESRGEIFLDGFESSDTGRWSSSSP